jgi:hypothetical protein
VVKLRRKTADRGLEKGKKKEKQQRKECTSDSVLGRRAVDLSFAHNDGPGNKREQ